MAIFHQHVGYVSRSTGRSSVQCAAYILGEKIVEDRRGITANYENKSKNGQISYKGTVLPEGVNEKYKDASVLWNAVENNEDRVAKEQYKTPETQNKYLQSARTAQTDEFALPIELSHEAHKRIMDEYIKEFYVSKGLGVTFSKHNDEGNPHAHLEITMRTFKEDGSFSKYKCRSITTRQSLRQRRLLLAEITNKVLEQNGIDARVDARSFEDQGLNLIPTVHEGWQARDRVERGLQSNLVNENISIRSKNAEKLMDHATILFAELTTNKATFSRGDIIKAVQNRTLDNPNHMQYVYETVLKNAVTVGEDFQGHPRYTSPEYHQKEQNLLGNLGSLVESKVDKVISQSTIDFYIENFRKSGGKMSDEQEIAVRNLCSDRQLSALVGRAGTGKTTSVLKPIVDLHKQAGFTVMGMSLAAEAAQNLAKETGCVAHSMEHYLYRWDKIVEFEKALKYKDLSANEFNKITKKLEKYRETLPTENTVIIVDEAGMSGTHDWNRLINKVIETGAKLIVCGDDRQLKAVSAGDVFRLVVEMGNTLGFKSEVTQIFRQNEDWMRSTSMQLANQETGEALVTYEQRGHVKESSSEATMVQAIADEYVERVVQNLKDNPTGDPKKHKTGVVMTSTHKVRLDLNTAIRDNLQKNELIGQDLVAVGGKTFAVGDQILFTKNDHSQWDVKSDSKDFSVQNGTRGTVVSIEEITQNVEVEGKCFTINTHEFAVRVDDGKDLVRFTLNDYKNIEHAYAMTVHKCQGKTLDWAIAHIGSIQNMESLYVMLTRHRDDVSIHYNREDYESYKNLVRSISIGLKDLACDYTIKPENEEFFFNIQDYKQIGQEICEAMRTGEGTDRLMTERKEVAYQIAETWDEHKSFANQAGLSKEMVEITAGLRVRPMTTHEEKAQIAVEAYVILANEARETWNTIRKSCPASGYKHHDLYPTFDEQRLDRGKAAALVIEFGSLARPFVHEAHKDIGYGMKVIQGQADAVRTLLFQKELRQRAVKSKDMDTLKKLDTLVAYMDARDLFRSEWSNYKREEQSLKSTLLEASLETLKERAQYHGTQRDVLAYKITQEMDEFKTLADTIGHSLNGTQLFDEAEKGKRHLCVKEYLNAKGDLGKSTAAYELYSQWQGEKAVGKKEAISHIMKSGINPLELIEYANVFVRINLKASLSTDKEKDLFSKLTEYNQRVEDYKYSLGSCFAVRMNPNDPFYKSPNYPHYQAAIKERDLAATNLLESHSVSDIQSMGGRMNIYAKNVDANVLEGRKKDADRTYLIEAYRTATDENFRLEIAHELVQLIDAERAKDFDGKTLKAQDQQIQEQDGVTNGQDMTDQDAKSTSPVRGKSKTTRNLYHEHGITEKEVRADALQFHRNTVMKSLTNEDDKLLASQLDQYESLCIKSSMIYDKCKKEAKDKDIKTYQTKSFPEYKAIIGPRDQVAKGIFDIATSDEVSSMAQRLKISEYNVSIETLMLRAENGNRDELISKYLKPVATIKEIIARDRAAFALNRLWKLESSLGEKDTIRNIHFAKIDIKELSTNSSRYQNNVVYKNLKTGEEQEIFKQVIAYAQKCRQTADVFKTCKTEADAANIKPWETQGYGQYLELSTQRNALAHDIKTTPRQEIIHEITKKLDIYPKDMDCKTLWERSHAHESKVHMERYLTLAAEVNKNRDAAEIAKDVTSKSATLTSENWNRRIQLTESAAYLIEAMNQEKEAGRGKPTAARLYKENADFAQVSDLAREHVINKVKAEFQDDPSNSLVDKLIDYGKLSQEASKAFIKCIPEKTTNPLMKQEQDKDQTHDKTKRPYVKGDLKPWESPHHSAYVEICVKRDDIADSISRKHDYTSTYVVADKLKVDITKIDNHTHDHDMRFAREMLFCEKDKVEAHAATHLLEWNNIQCVEEKKSTYRILKEKGLVPEDLKNRIDNYYKLRDRRQPSPLVENTQSERIDVPKTSQKMAQPGREQAQEIRTKDSDIVINNDSRNAYDNQKQGNKLTRASYPIKKEIKTRTIDVTIKTYEGDTIKEIEEKLNDHIDRIVGMFYQKTFKNTANEIRLGVTGKISITKQGPHRGRYKNFSSGSGGSMINFMADELGTDFKGGLKNAKEFLGGNYRAPEFETKNIEVKEDKNWRDDWRVMNPIPQDVKILTPADIMNHSYLKKGLDGNKVISTHQYKNEDGSVHFLMVRTDASYAKTKPLSYCENIKTGQKRWIRMAPNNPRPIYGLDKIYQDNINNDLARPVLVVEGEKTADAATKLYPNYTVVSWSFGSGSVGNFDWKILTGRNVVVFPDHDDPGHKAAEKLCQILTQHNKEAGKTPIVSSIKLPLSEFEPEWDLADSLPKGWDDKKMKTLIENHFNTSVRPSEKAAKNISDLKPSEFPLSLDTHIATVLAKSQDLDPKTIDKMTINQIREQFNVIDKAYRAENVPMDVHQKNHHIKQLCHISQMAKDSIDQFSREMAPSKARETAIQRGLLYGAHIEKADDFKISQSNIRMERSMAFHEQFDKNILKVQDTIQRQHPSLDEHTVKSLANAQVTLMTLTDNKVTFTDFIQKKANIIESNQKLIADGGRDLAEKMMSYAKHFGSKETIETAKNAIIDQIIRQDSSVLKSSYALVESSKSAIVNDLSTHQKEIHQRDAQDRQRLAQREQDQWQR